MSPEQADGRTDLVDARSDIYSLGAVAYFLLTGRPPFVRPTLQDTLLAHRQHPPTPPAQVRPDVPADVEAVVMKCLAKDPADRYEDADALDEALSKCACAHDWTRADAAAWWRTISEVR
jgi:serine/threonine-protein kinase